MGGGGKRHFPDLVLVEYILGGQRKEGTKSSSSTRTTVVDSSAVEPVRRTIQKQSINNIFVKSTGQLGKPISPTDDLDTIRGRCEEHRRVHRWNRPQFAT